MKNKNTFNIKGLIINTVLGFGISGAVIFGATMFVSGEEETNNIKVAQEAESLALRKKAMNCQKLSLCLQVYLQKRNWKIHLKQTERKIIQSRYIFQKKNLITLTTLVLYAKTTT